jgi:hypothetical protein
MKYLLTLLATLAISTSAVAQDSMTDGFCTMDVLAMEKAVHIDSSSSTHNNTSTKFYTKALEAAKNQYQGMELSINENDEILVKSSKLLYGEDAYGSDTRMIGTKISLWMDGDEDIITYYYYANETFTPKLKMYLHDEQSATAYWTCEF